jgi:hypothetical protein
MTLLADLQSIDLGQIVTARASIRAAVDNPELQAVLDGGAAQSALAGLGGGLQTLREGFDEPAALLQPLVEAVTGLLAPLSTDDLPLDRYLEAVQAGAALIAGLLQGFGSDASQFGASLPGLAGGPGGTSLGGTLDRVQALVGDVTQVSLAEDLGRFRRTVELVERGVPLDPQAFAGLAVEVLLPFPRSNLLQMRQIASQALAGTAALALPPGRTSGLTVALEAVATVAARGDAAALEQALADLERARNNTLSVLGNDLLRFQQELGRLRLDQLLEPLVTASRGLRNAGEGMLEYLERWRRLLAAVRQGVEGLSAADVSAMMAQIVGLMEDAARTEVFQVYEAAVLKIEEWIRALFRELSLRPLRARVTAFFRAAAQAIRDADLDRPAREVRALLDEIESTAGSADLAAQVQAALQEIQALLDGTLGQVLGALETISGAVDDVAAEAEAILQRAVAALAAFRSSLDEITAAVEQLGIDEATRQVVAAIRDLRETAEELLTAAPLPEPMRPLIEQLIATLEGVDLEVAFRPVRTAVAELQIPDEVSATLTEALQATAGALDNLIPAELIASIEAEVGAALDVIRDFDPASLLGEVTAFVEEAAAFVEGLDPVPFVDQVRGPFQAVLDAIDAVHPRVLLAPVIEAYDGVLGSVSILSPDVAMDSLSTLAGASGENLARSTMAPVSQLAPQGAVTSGAPGGDGAGDSGGGTPSPSQPPPLAGDFRPGDVVRVLAYLPDKLREALSTLEAGPAGQALAAVDALCAGLARDLRALRAALNDVERRLAADLDALLAPLGPAQLRAQLSIRASFDGGSLDVDGALAVVAQAGPGAMRHHLAGNTRAARGEVRSASLALSGRAGAALDAAAQALESSLLASLTGDLDAFLAALDPEPIAAELDALTAALFAKTPELLDALGDELLAVESRFRALVEELSPGSQVDRFARVLDVLRQEIDVLDPGRLADELGEVHAALRRAVAAYDPAVFAAEIRELVMGVASELRALDPAALLGDLSLLDDIAARVEAALPTQALAGVGESLAGVGEELRRLDPSGLLDAVEALGPQLIAAFEQAVEAIRQEMVALLQALRYASTSARAQVEVGVG